MIWNLWRRRWYPMAVAVACAIYILRRLRVRLKTLALPHAPRIPYHWFLAEFGGVLLKCPRVPNTENRPDLMSFWHEAAEETREQGFFHQGFMHWLLPFSADLVIVHDFKLAKQVLAKESWALYKKGRSYRIAADLIGNRALLASPDNDAWRCQRQLINTAFRKSLIEVSLIPNVRAVVDSMCHEWEKAAMSAGGERPSIEFYQEAVSLAIDILGRFAFGFDFSHGKEGKSQPLNIAFQHVLHRMCSFGRNPLSFPFRKLPTKDNRTYWNALNTIEVAVKATIKSRIAQGTTGDDLLGQLLQAARRDEAPMDEDLIIENLKTFLFAGHDTTASTLSWAIYLLATHPEEESTLIAELNSALGTGEPSYEALEALPYLDAVFKETLRLYPPAGFTREPVQDVELGPYTVPKGTEIFIFPYLVHRDERLFQRAAKFEPSRWVREKGKVAPESTGWMPFSLGARNCIGAQLAKLEIKVALHALLSRYRFELAPQCSKPAVVLYMTLVPTAITVIPRHRVAQ